MNGKLEKSLYMKSLECRQKDLKIVLNCNFKQTQSIN